jgi:hypothetical protein
MTQQQWEAKYLESQEKPVDPNAVTSTGGASPVVGTLGEIKSIGVENVIGGGSDLAVPAQYEVVSDERTEENEESGG